MIPPADQGAVSEVEAALKERIEKADRVAANGRASYVSVQLSFDLADSILAALSLLRQLQQENHALHRSLVAINETPSWIASEQLRAKLQAAEASLTALREQLQAERRLRLEDTAAHLDTVTALRGEQEQLQQREAEAHDVLSAFVAAADPDDPVLDKLVANANRILGAESPDGHCGNPICAELSRLQAAEATGEAKPRCLDCGSVIDAGYCTDCSAQEPFERTVQKLKATEQQLADRSAAIAQIVQEMREEASHPARKAMTHFSIEYAKVDQWADRLDAVGAERTTQKIEESAK